MRQIVLDTETTGLSAENGDRILEIGCVELLNRQLTGNDRHYYINPERESHEDALRVHGITSEFLKDKPLFHQIADEFLDYIQGAELIIHNAPFDLGFLNKELELCQHPTLKSAGSQVIDTLLLAREKFPGKRNSLDALCDRFEIDNSERVLHGALLDAQLLAEVYICLTRGQHSLIDQPQSTGMQQQNGKVNQIDFSVFNLPIIAPTAEELRQHQQVLEQITKESGGKIIWQTETPHKLQ